MLSLILSSPIRLGQLRSLRNQRWSPTDEAIVFVAPGEEAELAVQGLQVAGLIPNLKVLEPPMEERLPPWDALVQGVAEAANDWVWLLPPEMKPAPMALETIRGAIEAREDAKIHVFRAYGLNGCLMPSHPAREAFVPREMTVACAVVPRGLARLATFHAGQWGDLAWLDEAARLHPAGEGSVVWHNRLVAVRDTDTVYIEERLGDATPRWSFRPQEFIKTSEKEEVGTLELAHVGEGWLGQLRLAEKARGMGYRAPLARFALEACSGERLTLRGPGEDDVEEHAGLCYLWDEFEKHAGAKA